jgi:DNA-directed RNA polymerase specialized sigma24 family protein
MIKPALARFESLNDLIACFRDQSVDYRVKNPVAVELCLLCQQGDEAAKLVLMELYLPMLYRAAAELMGRGLDLEELDSLLLVGFWEAVSQITEASTKVSGTLRRGSRRTASKAIGELKKSEKAESSLEQMVEVKDLHWAGRGGAAAVLDRAVSQEVITDAEARLIQATRLDCSTLQQISEELGRSAGSLKLARHRAEARLVAWIQGRDPPARRKVSSRV